MAVQILIWKLLHYFHAVTKVGFEMKEYILVEGDTSSVCVTYNKVLEKSISVNYTLMNAMVAGELV